MGLKAPHVYRRPRLPKIKSRLARWAKSATVFLLKLFVIGMVTIDAQACRVMRPMNIFRSPRVSRPTGPNLDTTQQKLEVDTFTGLVTGRGAGAANDAPPPRLSTPPPIGQTAAIPPGSPNPSTGSTGSTGISINPKTKKTGYSRLEESDIDPPPVVTPKPTADVAPAPRPSSKPVILDTGTGAVHKKPKSPLPDDSLVDLPPVTLPPIPRNQVTLPPDSPSLKQKILNKFGDFAYQSGVATVSGIASSSPFYVMTAAQQPQTLPPPVTINNQKHYAQTPYPFHLDKDLPTVPATSQLATNHLPDYRAPEQIRLGSRPTAVPVVNPATVAGTAVVVKTPTPPTKMPTIAQPTPRPHFFTRTLDTCQQHLRRCQILSMATAAIVSTATTVGIYEIYDSINEADEHDDISLLAWLYRLLQKIADETGKTLPEVLHIVMNFPPRNIKKAHLIATALEEANTFRQKYGLPLDFQYSDKQAQINIKYLDFVQLLMAARGNELLTYIESTMAEMLLREPNLLVQAKPPTNIPEF